MSNFIKFLSLNKKKVFIYTIVFICVCVLFFLLYRFINPKKEICTLEQKYSNYQNNIEFTIIRNSAIRKEIFKSKDKNILIYKEKELKKDGFYIIKNKNRLVSTKNVENNNLKDKLVSSGYVCGDKKKNIKIQYNLNDGDDKLEVKTEYKSELDKAFVNNKDYFKKVIINNNIDNNELGSYVVSYKLNVSKYRSEYIYKTLNVVDTTPPEIKLKGDSIISITKGDKFNDPLYDVKDNYDDSDSIKVKVDGVVDTNSIGTYKIVYTASDRSKNESKVERTVFVKEKNNGLTYIKGILIVNKKYSVPRDYNPGLLPETKSAYDELAKDASSVGYNIPLISGFRSYDLQNTIYNNYVHLYGKEQADTFSAQPGHSEHQSGLAMDVGKIDDDYGSTPEGKWLAANAHKYGFIIRYQKGKESITGYKYEPWHIRYLGREIATKVYNSGLTLEEYLGVA